MKGRGTMYREKQPAEIEERIEKYGTGSMEKRNQVGSVYESEEKTTVYHLLGLKTAQKSIKASSVNRRDSSSSMPFTSWSILSRFCTILTVGRRMGDGDVAEDGASITVEGAFFRDILSPRLLIIDMDLVILDRGCSITVRDGVGVGSLFSSADVGVD